MGRYDKIRCWNGSSWVQPSQMYVWNGSSWVDFGTNDSDNTRTMYSWDGSSWARRTLNRQVNYGAKEWVVTGSGWGGYMNAGDIGANVNQNVFNFYFYCAKDADNDKTIAYYGDTDFGWEILWLADGRLRWRCFYGGGYSQSYTSNYRGAHNWSVVNAYRNSAGTHNGEINFGGTVSGIACGYRHQAYRGINIGQWGLYYRDVIRLYGINSGGSYVDTYTYINNFAVGAGAQNNGVFHTNSNTTVYQDTSISWV